MGSQRTFAESLAISNHYSQDKVWENIYKSVFSNFHAMVDYSHNGIHQKRGVDRIILLKDGTAFKVDEKIRVKAFDDIALEYASVVRNGKIEALGWVCDPEKDSDYIAYAVNPLGSGYIFPYKDLKRAWITYGEAWIQKYRQRYHKGCTYRNGLVDYETFFCPVPAKEIFKAIYVTSAFTFQKSSLAPNVSY
jgi:hypothetical protein